jgi:hypothetical protein
MRLWTDREAAGMKRLGIVLGCVCVFGLLMMVALGGCAEQPQDTTGVEPPPPMENGEAGAADGDESAEATDGEAASEDVETLADLVDQWPESFVMTQKVTDTETDETTTFEMAMKMGEEQPLKVRMEMQQGGALIDYEERVQYAWTAESGTVMKMDLSETQMEHENPYADIDPDSKITGSETIDGVECWIVETTDTEGKTVTSWVSKEHGLMQRTETENTVVEYEYQQIGSVPDSEFQVPEGMTIEEVQMPDVEDIPDMEDMPEMPEDMPGR